MFLFFIKNLSILIKNLMKFNFLHFFTNDLQAKNLGLRIQKIENWGKKL